MRGRRAAEREREQGGGEQAERRHWQILLAKAGSKTLRKPVCNRRLSSCCFWPGSGLAATISSALTHPGVPIGETGFCARGKFARGLVVAAQKGGLRRRQIGLRIVALAAIGHRELGIAERRLGLPRHRRAQNRNRFLGVGLIIGATSACPSNISMSGALFDSCTALRNGAIASAGLPPSSSAWPRNS